MPVNSRAKGARGERLWRDVLREAGFTARRGQQFAGGGDSPDVVCDEMTETFHPEVKFVEKLNLRDAMEQAQRDATDGKIPYVAHKTKSRPWLVTIDAQDFLTLARLYLAEHAPPITTQ